MIQQAPSSFHKQVAKALDANNAKAVYIIGRREASLKNAASQCPNGKVIPLVGDVTSKSSLSSLADRIKAEHGYIDVLFANSGVGGPASPVSTHGDAKPSLDDWLKASWSIDMADFTRTFEVNVTGAYYTCLAFVSLLDEGNKRNIGESARRQKSQIVITSSIAGFNRSFANNPAYPASKAAVVNLVKTLATHLNRFHIRVNSIAPGLYPSEMTAGHGAVKEGMQPDVEGALDGSVCPLERMGSEEDMAAMALWMMGRGGSYLAGSVVLSDGGRLGQLPATY